MDLTIRSFLFALIVMAMVALLYLKPYHVTFREKRGIPQVAFFDFETYEIEAKGVFKHLRGDVAEKFGKRTVVEKPFLRRLADRGEERVSADRAIFVENRSVALQNHVRLRREDGWMMETNRLRYDLPNHLYTTEGAPFVITYGQSVIHGQALRYDQKRGTIQARTIHASIAEEDR